MALCWLGYGTVDHYVNFHENLMISRGSRLADSLPMDHGKGDLPWVMPENSTLPLCHQACFVAPTGLCRQLQCGTFDPALMSLAASRCDRSGNG